MIKNQCFILILIVAFIFSCTDRHDHTDSVKATTVLETTTSWNGEPLQYPEGQAEVTGMVIEIEPGEETGWHYHPVPNFGYLLEGSLEVTLEDGRTLHMEPGEAISEVVNTYHIGKNTGRKPVKIVVFYAGVDDMELTVMK